METPADLTSPLWSPGSRFHFSLLLSHPSDAAEETETRSVKTSRTGGRDHHRLPLMEQGRAWRDPRKQHAKSNTHTLNSAVHLLPSTGDQEPSGFTSRSLSLLCFAHTPQASPGRLLEESCSNICPSEVGAHSSDACVHKQKLSSCREASGCGIEGEGGVSAQARGGGAA